MNSVLEIKEGLATLTLNRPAAYNSFDGPLVEELLGIFRTLENDPEVRVLILTGAGQAFCPGADLKYIREQLTGPAEGRNLIKRVGE